MRTALWLWTRSEVRRRLGATTAITLLLGLGLAVVLAAVSGARRTETAYPRMLEATNASDILVNPDQGVGSALDPADVAALPNVESMGFLAGMFVLPSDDEGAPDFESQALTLASRGGVFGYEIDRPLLTSGRMPDPDRVDEVFVDEAFAATNDLHVGDHFTFHVVDVERSDPDQFPPATNPLEMTVTGIGIASDQILVDEAYAFEQVILTPAFYRAYEETMGFYGLDVQVAGDAGDLLAFRRRVEALVPEESVEFRTQALVTQSVQRSARPLVVSLYAFGALVAVATLALIAQAMGRVLAVDRDERRALGAVGVTRPALFGALVLRAAVIAAVAAAIGAIGAVLLSPLFPIGFVRPAEPDPGITVNVAALVGASAVLLGLLMALVAIGTWVATRPGAGEAGRSVRRTSRLAELLRRGGAGPSLATGVQFALEPLAGRGSATLASTMVGGIVLVTLVSGSLAFGASLHRLVDTPRLYGWTWDVLVASETPPAELDETFGSIPGIEGMSAVTNSRITLDGQPVPAIAFSRQPPSVAPTIVDGRAPREPDEVALGSRTLERLDADIGDEVDATTNDGATVPLTIVGQAAFSGIGTYPGADRTELGRGALVTPEGLAELGPAFDQTGVVLDAGDEVSPTELEASVREVLGDELEGDDQLLVDPQQPSDIVALDRVRNTPILLALLLATLILIASTIALFSSSRGRRHDLAILETIGFRRRQVAATVTCEALTIVLIAFVVGLPIGVATGRWVWAQLAKELGAVADPVTPWGLLGAFVLVGLVGNAVLALGAGWFLARRDPAIELRSE